MTASCGSIDGSWGKLSGSPGAPPLICLTGIDGCGKSTQVRLLTARLRAGGWEAVSLWAGGNKPVSRLLVRAGQRALGAPRRGRDRRFHARDAARRTASDEFSAYLSASNHLFGRHGLLRRAWTDLALFEHALEINLAVRPQLRAGRAVVCDRYLYRSLVNLAVLLDLPPSRLPALLRHPALRLAPRPTLYVLLDAPAEVAYGRKQDLPGIEYVRRRVPIYRALAALTGMPAVDATQPPDAVHAQIWETVAGSLAACSAATAQRLARRLV